MGNTFFYQQVKSDVSKITWKDIFSEFRKKHTKQDLEYALSAGTSLNTATEENMLSKWQKPWIWYPLLKGGLVLVFGLYLVFFLLLSMMGGYVPEALWVMVMIIPPIVMPFILMVFLWELNIPKNISVYEQFLVFLFGGLGSIAIAFVFFMFVPSEPAGFAAFAEEPAKILTAVIFLVLFSKNKKIYGLTGLVVGAAVGAGFGGFESIYYAFGSQGYGMLAVIDNQVIRGIFALGGHTLYCAPYSAALALATQKEGKLTLNCFLEKDFLLTFAFSVAMHFSWNSIGYLGLGTGGSYALYIVIIVALWVNLLRIVKRCLYQVIAPAHYQSGSSAYTHAGQSTTTPVQSVAGKIIVKCVSGALNGAIWMSNGAEVLTIGREQGNVFKMPEQANGVSRRHCSIQMTNQGWTVRDLNSTYGTYLNQGKKLVPGIDQPLHSGDVIYIGGMQHAFQVTVQ